MLHQHPQCPSCSVTLSYLCQQDGDVEGKRYSCIECNSHYVLTGSDLIQVSVGVPEPPQRRTALLLWAA